MIVFLLLAVETLGENEFPTKHNLNQTISQGKCRAKSQLNSSIEADWLGCPVWLQATAPKIPMSEGEQIDSPLLCRGAEPTHFHNATAKIVIHSFIHSISQYLLSTYPVPCAVWELDTAGNKTDRVTVLMKSTLLVEGETNKQTKSMSGTNKYYEKN